MAEESKVSVGYSFIFLIVGTFHIRNKFISFVLKQVWTEKISVLIKSTNELIKKTPPNLDLTRLEIANNNHLTNLNLVEKSGMPGFLSEPQSPKKTG